MQVFETLDLPAQPACSVALGAFDGLHRGHMAVIQAALATRLEPAVCTFRSSPSGEPMLATPAHKALLLRQAGVRRLYTLDFPSVKAMPPQTFVEDVLFRRLHARHLCCGEDFRFGHAASGDANLLARLCQAGGVTLSVLPPVTEGGEKISPTRIRQAIRGGDIPLANRLLGRPFGFTLEVIHGNHLGSTQLGAPTINQALPAGFVLPRFGVYAAGGGAGILWRMQYRGQAHRGLGLRPGRNLDARFFRRPLRPGDPRQPAGLHPPGAQIPLPGGTPGRDPPQRPPGAGHRPNPTNGPVNNQKALQGTNLGGPFFMEPADLHPA